MGCCTSLLYGSIVASENAVKEQLTLIRLRITSYDCRMVSVSEASDVAQAIGNIAVVISLLFLYRQTKITRQQMEDSRKAQQQQVDLIQSQVKHSQVISQGANIFALIDYLERPEHLSARRHVAGLKNKPFKRWSKRDIAAADTVARIYQVASSFQFSEIIPPKWLHIQYGGSMLRVWEILKPYIADLRARTEPTQRRDFERLCDEMRSLGWYDPSTGKVPPYFETLAAGK